MGKIGVVFAGGGGKGSYQVGVWKALKELEIDKYIDGVSGTSIGALNGAMFLQNRYESAENVWLNISQEKMLPVDKRLILRNLIFMEISRNKLENIVQWAERVERYGTVTREGLLEIIDQNIDYEIIKNEKRPFYINCTSVPDLESKYFKVNGYEEEDIRLLLSATTSIPLVFNKVLIDGKYYIDGGMKDNIPIKPLYDEGFSTIIVIYFHKENRINKEEYPNANIIEILPSKDQGGWISGTLDFTNFGSIERIIDGYKDTLNIFKNVLDSFKQGEDLELHLRDNKKPLESNLEEGLQYETSIKDNVKRIKHMRVVDNNLKNVRKLRRINNKKGIFQKLKDITILNNKIK
ncbi:phospholipase, patatin family [Clostridium putrefaciens]|uniref:Phospholipase, patatin family n=1 Tax=Clostridium putrefaciens TaxID=99675 RepID=A0A381J5X0_9CLOT|nr:patatin-like phospholipase family protein [Clostridium putrefaciens]SUY45589.1 phospholipase, patatin family [Clostridium putrefaciens]